MSGPRMWPKVHQYAIRWGVLPNRLMLRIGQAGGPSLILRPTPYMYMWFFGSWTGIVFVTPPRGYGAFRVRFLFSRALRDLPGAAPREPSRWP